MLNQRLLSHPVHIRDWTFHMTLSCPNRAPSLIHHLIPITRTPDPFISSPLQLHHRLLPQTHLHPNLQTFGRLGPRSVTRTMHSNVLLSALTHLSRFSTLFQMRGSHNTVTASIVLNAARQIPPNRRRTMRQAMRKRRGVLSFHQLLRDLRMEFPVHLCHR